MPDRRRLEPLRADERPGAPFHRWLLIAGAIAYGIYAGFRSGYLPLLILGDPTRLSFAVALLFVAANLYIGWQAFEISRQHDVLLDHLAGRPTPEHAWATDYLRERATLQGADATALGDLLHERIKGRTEPGWFSAGLHIKLGLLGTVIGFVMMLGSIGTAHDLQAQGLDTLIQGMGTGMRVSLYHTILGLIGSMLVGLEMLFVDRSADRLFGLIITLPDPGARRPL